jgi:predicted nucleotidyltransferase
MATLTLPPEFREFLRLLNEHEVKYLLIGGYAVGFYGYPRTTADMDIWFAISQDNAQRLLDVFIAFGLTDAGLCPQTFMQSDKIIRLGVPPMRIEVMAEIDGVAFADCYHSKHVAVIDGEKVPLISKEHLIANKRASGRYKDLDDLEHLTDPTKRT